MKKLLFLCFLFVSACQTIGQGNYNIKGDTNDLPGWVSVFQTATSSTETTINILRPRLAELNYEVEGLGNQKIIKTVSGPHIHWKVDRIHIKDLSPQKKYRLNVRKKRGNRIIDWREFKSLNTDKKSAQFIVGSCMSDSHAFKHVRDRIWDRIQSHDVDFLLLLGDQVYVDDFDFVKRQKANEFDIWTRYIDSLRKIPLFQMRKLTPVFAVWDDHDFGTNDSDKNFKSKKAAEKIFTAFFGGENIKGVYESSKSGVFASFDGFGHRFLLMDNRYYREPSQKKAFGHWGKKQHQWFKEKLTQSQNPIWLANGNQFFAPATIITRKNGSKKQINESFYADHPEHFKTLMSDIKKAQSPVAFLSGDIHLSELVEVEKELLGYKTYEVTSSPLHSYIFRSKSGEQKFLNNPRRIIGHKDHNYILVESSKVEGRWNIKATSYGVTQDAPYFQKEFSIKK